MRRLLLSIVAASLLLPFGTLSVMVRPNSSISVGAAASDLAAPAATYKYNDISLVLNVPSVTDAASLATYAGSYVKRVLRYNANTQSFQVYVVGNPATNFSLATGDFVFLLVDSTAPNSLAFVGNVPDQGSVSFSLVSGSPAKYNFLSLPLDKTNLTSASAVAGEVGTGVVRVLRYQGETQSFQVYIVGNPATDFPLAIGEPFLLLLSSGARSKWP